MSNRITPDDLPWDKLKKWGITRERMEKTGNLDRLLYGNYSKPVPFFRNDGGQKIEGEAAIRCYKSGDTWKIDMQTRCEKPTMKDWIGVYGTQLSEEQKKQLLDTGHAGSPLVFKDKDGKENSVFVSLNPETNRVVTFPTQYATLPKEGGVEGKIAGVVMNDEQKAAYLKGEPVHLKDLTNSKGEKFESCVQFSAYERRAVYTTPEWLREQKKAAEAQSQNQSQESTQKKETKKEKEAKQQKQQTEEKKASRGMKH